MDDDRSHERFEIELTERPSGRWRARRGDAPGPSAAEPEPTMPFSVGVTTMPAAPPTATGEVADGPGPLRTERGRLVAAVLGVGAVALFLGWAVGRSGGSPSTEESSSTTTPSRSVPSTTAEVSGDTLDTIQPTTTVRPTPAVVTTIRTTTTTEPPRWEQSIHNVPPELAATNDRIVAITDDDGLLELDLATGWTERLATDLRSDAGFPTELVAGNGWLLLPSPNGERSLLFSDGAVFPAVVSISIRESFWQPDTDLFWELDYDSDFNYIERVVETRFDGVETGRVLELDRHWVQSVDPAGGLFVGDNGGLFTVTPDGSQRIEAGYILAGSSSRLLAHACGDTLETCGLAVIDRGTGETRPLPDHPALEGEQLDNASFYGLPNPRPTMSPDDASAIVAFVTNDGAPEFGVVDLESGEFQAVLSRSEQIDFSTPPLVWSGDSRYVYHIVDGRLSAFDVATGLTIEISDSLPDITSFTIRPPSAVAAG